MFIRNVLGNRIKTWMMNSNISINDIAEDFLFVEFWATHQPRNL